MVLQLFHISSAWSLHTELTTMHLYVICCPVWLYKSLYTNLCLCPFPT